MNKILITIAYAVCIVIMFFVAVGIFGATGMLIKAIFGLNSNAATGANWVLWMIALLAVVFYKTE